MMASARVCEEMTTTPTSPPKPGRRPPPRATSCPSTTSSSTSKVNAANERMLRGRGVDGGDTPLAISAAYGMPAIMRYLLGRGADPTWMVEQRNNEFLCNNFEDWIIT
ncbi:uncharacterized protein [Triticum aestivum]|uniref:uncharacterized protein n=1 Tax=Triticum aestivum TaxID=4565 RepID=UPI001D034CA0|nr:uncharacterized protein LOC123159681 [Triticum aestivum]